MGHLFEILVVDDNPAEIVIMQAAFEDARVANRLHIASGGAEAMAFLHREGKYGTAPRPNLIMLDLHMPGKGGLEVLAEIKQDPDLLSIPTVILTSSRNEVEVAKAYALHANGFVVKPVDLDELIEVVGGIEEYWSGIVRLPSTPVHAV